MIAICMHVHDKTGGYIPLKGKFCRLNRVDGTVRMDAQKVPSSALKATARKTAQNRRVIYGNSRCFGIGVPKHL